MSTASRRARRRQREKDGLGVWPVEVHENLTADALIKAGFLTEEQSASREACCEAMARVVRLWVKELVTRDLE